MQGKKKMPEWMKWTIGLLTVGPGLLALAYFGTYAPRTPGAPYTPEDKTFSKAMLMHSWFNQLFGGVDVDVWVKAKNNEVRLVKKQKNVIVNDVYFIDESGQKTRDLPTSVDSPHGVSLQILHYHVVKNGKEIQTVDVR